MEAPPPTSMLLLTFTKLAIPQALTNLTLLVGGMTVLIFASRIDSTFAIAAIGLANTFSGIMIQSLMLGINCAQETLTSQAFGAGNLRLCGLRSSPGPHRSRVEPLRRR